MEPEIKSTNFPQRPHHHHKLPTLCLFLESNRKPHSSTRKFGINSYANSNTNAITIALAKTNDKGNIVTPVTLANGASYKHPQIEPDYHEKERTVKTVESVIYTDVVTLNFSA
jgi:hypothetical protein